MQHLRLVETAQDAVADDDVLSNQVARLPGTQIPDAQHIAATVHSSRFQCSHYTMKGHISHVLEKPSRLATRGWPHKRLLVT